MLVHDYKLPTATAINYASMISNMLSFLLFSSILLVLSPSAAVTSAQTQARGDSCGACNCQFNNVDILIDLIRTEINSVLSQQIYGMVKSGLKGTTVC